MRDFFRPARRVGGGNGTKFSLLTQNGPKSVFWGVLGEFCTGWAADPGGRAMFVALLGLMWVRARKSSPCAGLGCSAAHEVGCGGGFCSIRSWLSACRRRVVVLVVRFPPFGGGEAAT